MERRKIARWESKGGAHAVTLYADAYGYDYQSRGCGGFLGRLGSDHLAVDCIQERVSRGDFQPDANKTPMRRMRAH